VIIMLRKSVGDDKQRIVPVLEKQYANLQRLYVSSMDVIDGCDNLANKYDIQKILRTIAKVQNITAKDMAQKKVPEYFPVPISFLNHIKTINYNVFIQGSDEGSYFPILEAGAQVSLNLEDLKAKDVKKLYIKSQDRLKFINDSSMMMVKELSRKDISNSEKVTITKRAQGVIAANLFDSEEMSSELADISNQCVEAIDQVVSDTPKLKSLLNSLKSNESGYVYKHGIVATFIANKLMKEISWGSEEAAKKITFAFFFHDIFLVNLYEKYSGVLSEEDLLFNGEITDEDKEIVLKHAKMARDLVTTFPRAPMGVDAIIRQHHGMRNGIGFSPEFKDDVSPLSKLMIISEEIAGCALETFEKDKQKIKINKEKMIDQLKQKYSFHSYKKIIDAFAQTTL